MGKGVSAMIMGASRETKVPGARCATATVLLVLLSGAALAASAVPNGVGRHIGEAKAKSVALEHAGVPESRVTFVGVRLDYDDGRAVYDVEFYGGGTEFDYEIDAVSGTIVGYDHDLEYRAIPNDSANGENPLGQSRGEIASGGAGYIGEAEAKSIALSAAGLSESQVGRMKVGFEREDGKMVYEVEFDAGRTEYEYEIDAVGGAILKANVDYDD